MVRPISDERIEAIKQATYKLVAEQGIQSTSVAKIAIEAHVSKGIIYKLFNGKHELFESLFAESFFSIFNLLEKEFEKHNCVKQIIEIFIHRLLERASKEPEIIIFVHRLLSDITFKLPSEYIKNMITLGEKIIAKGIKTKEISTNITSEMLYSIMIASVLQFINTRIQGNFCQHDLNNNDELILVNIISKSLN